MDPNWNPAYDLQAQDRAYRIGQRRDVEVFRLISSGTIEEIVYARQIYKQQQANIGYTASNERRYFKGVQASSNQKGEIFGLANLLAYAGDQIVLRNIVNKTNVAESKIGVNVLDIGLDPSGDAEGDPLLSNVGGKNEDRAMQQLAKFIESGATTNSPIPDLSQNQDGSQGSSGGSGGKATKKRKLARVSDPVQAILAGAGVEYTHENSEVIGSSRVEAHLSRKAEEGGWDVDVGQKQAFRDTQSQSQSQKRARIRAAIEGRDGGGREGVVGDDDDDDDGEIEAGEESSRSLDLDAVDDGDGGRGFKYVYKPPPEVCRRQFCTMAKTFGYDDPITFALVVESWTQDERRNCLDRFYAVRRKETMEGEKISSPVKGQEKREEQESKGVEGGWDDSY